MVIVIEYAALRFVNRHYLAYYEPYSVVSVNSTRLLITQWASSEHNILARGHKCVDHFSLFQHKEITDDEKLQIPDNVQSHPLSSIHHFEKHFYSIILI